MQAGSFVRIDTGLYGKRIARQIGIARSNAAVFHSGTGCRKRVGDSHIVSLLVNVAGLQKIWGAPAFLVKAATNAENQGKYQYQ